MPKFIGKISVETRNPADSKYRSFLIRCAIFDSEYGFRSTYFTFSAQGNQDTPGYNYALRPEQTPEFGSSDFDVFIAASAALKKAWRKESVPVAILGLSGEPRLSNDDVQSLVQAARKLGFIVKNDMGYDWTTRHPSRDAESTEAAPAYLN